MSHRVLLTCLVTFALPPGVANADFVYTFSTTLGIASGTDTAGLDGASVTLKFLVPEDFYVDRFAYPAIPVTDPTVKITGASVPGNNGTFATADLAFYPNFAGFFTEPDGQQLRFSLPGGGTLWMYGNLDPTPTGATVNVGDLVEESHLAPATPLPGLQWDTDDARYYLNNTTIRVSNPSKTPEPSALLLAGIALAGFGYSRRRPSL